MTVSGFESQHMTPSDIKRAFAHYNEMGSEKFLDITMKIGLSSESAREILRNSDGDGNGFLDPNELLHAIEAVINEESTSKE